jgi:hypothetical protein
MKKLNRQMTESNYENLVELSTYNEFINFAEGRLVYVEHPTKGIRKVISGKMLVNTSEL